MKSMCAIIAALIFAGCEGLEDAGWSADAPVSVEISGQAVVIDGKPAVAYQGIPYYVKDGLFSEGALVTVSGEAAPLLDRDGDGNSFFYGYSLR